MKKTISFFKKNWFFSLFVVIIFISIFLRFYDYSNRWGLAYDQANAAIIGRYALFNNQLPMLGPFSSAGPFQTGGEYYWLVMLGTAIYPFSVLSPWIALTGLSVLFVALLMLLGRKLENAQLGLVAGLLAAVSPGGISQAINLTNQSPLSFTSLLALFAMVWYLRTDQKRFLFFMGLFVGLGSSIHLQGAALIFLILISLLIKRPNLKGLIFLGLGLIIPWLPVLWVDFHNNFMNTHNMYYYYRYDQYNISLDVLGRRWLTYIGIFWPQAWANIVGGFDFTGYLLMGLTIIVTLVNGIKQRISKEWIAIIGSFLCAILMLRYVHTPLFDSYLVFLHPIIFLITAWSICLLIKKNKIIGIIVFMVVVGGSLQKDIINIIDAKNRSAERIEEWIHVLSTKHPNEKFAVYNYNNSASSVSISLSLFLSNDGKIDDNGLRIGAIDATDEATLKHPIIYRRKDDFILLDLSGSSSADLLYDKWTFMNPSSIYNQTEYWFLEKKK